MVFMMVSHMLFVFFFFSSRRRHTRFDCDRSSDVCSSDLSGTHQAKDELATAQITALIDQLAEAGCLNIFFTGGEIFTRGDLFEILAYAKIGRASCRERV